MVASPPHSPPRRTECPSQRSLRALAAIFFTAVAFTAAVSIHQIRTDHAAETATPLRDQFANWMSGNTASNVEISRVSCLDPAAFGSRATCQFTATVGPQDHPTYYHDFTCTAELDLAGTVTTVQCPANIAWILSTRVDQ